jgi:LPXTG-motif cell wall-anchored protein
VDWIDLAALGGLLIALGAWIWRSRRRSDVANAGHHRPPSDSAWGDGGGVDAGGGPA